MTDSQEAMDQRLRQYADRWREHVAESPRIVADQFTSSVNRRWAWWAVPAAAAAVVAVIVGAEVTNRATAPADPAPVQRSVKPGEVVPWAPLAATHPRLPRTTIPATPDPALTLKAPACRASQLRPEPEGDGAGGTVYWNVRLVLRDGREPCRLDGFPTIVPTDNGRTVGIPVRRITGDMSYQDPVLVARGQPAMLSLGWMSNWCAPPVHNDAIRAVLPDGAGVLSLPGFGHSPFCNSGENTGPVPIMVWPFQPERMHPAVVRSAYRHLRVDGDLTQTVRPGEQVRFVVTLTSPTRVVLNPCPDYTIAAYGHGVDNEQRFSLNCADVPFEDDGGRPYLPAHTPVRFAMKTIAPPRDAPKFLWRLETPEHSAVIGGQLTVK